VDLRTRWRTIAGGSLLVLSQSLVFGLAILPGLLLWQFVVESTHGFPLLDPYGRYVLIGTSIIPSYMLFAITFMFASAGWNRLAGWRTSPGEHRLHDYSWTVIKWASYNASINLVRMFVGELARATPLWTYYLKANGAQIGNGVYVNTARLYDHNMLVLKDKSVVGGDAKLIAHLVEEGKVKAKPVVIGRRSVIGVNTVIGPGVEVGDNSAIGAMSFVPKDTKVPANEAWGGVPARCIKKYAEGEFEAKQPGVPVAS
jgi:acetyltransferase-like isoleucine patch superfamily enzyme